MEHNELKPESNPFFSPDVKRPGINNRRVRRGSRKIARATATPRVVVLSLYISIPPSSLLSLSLFYPTLLSRVLAAVHAEGNVDTTCMYVRSEWSSRGSFSRTSHPAQARIRFPLIYRARLNFCASNDLSYRIFPHFNRGICARLINRPRLISRVQISPAIPGITVVTAICLGHCRSNERPTAPIIIYPLPFAYARILPGTRARANVSSRVSFFLSFLFSFPSRSIQIRVEQRGDIRGVDRGKDAK